MAGDSQFGPAPDSGALQRAVTPHFPRDPVALREAVKAAFAQGDGVSDVYATHVRPWLAAAAEGTSPLAEDRRAVARSAAQAALADLAGRLPMSDEGLGRRAAVLVPPGAVGELDAQAVADGLEAGGWSAALLALGGRAAEATVEAVVDARVEVVVAPVADAEQVLASQLPLAKLRRLNAPPLILGVAFGGGDSGAVAADHVIDGVDGIAPLLRRRITGGGHGAVAWGVRLHREDGALVVAPAGRLDATSVARLREIVETRRTLYPRILIDLRELLDADAAGLHALAAWHAERPWDPTVATLGDPRTRTALAHAGLTGTLPLTPPAGP
jgi:hypothetical protein